MFIFSTCLLCCLVIKHHTAIYYYSFLPCVYPCLQNAGAASLRRLQVVLLNGAKLNIICEPANTGQQLFDLVVSHLGLVQHYYYGITFEHGQYGQYANDKYIGMWLDS